MNPQEYFINHSLDPKFLKTLGWTWNDKVITIPIYGRDRNKLFDKYRHLQGDDKFTYEKGKHPTLYPLWKIKDHSKLVLCEGEPDCARLWQDNIPAITTVGGVGSFNEEMAQILKNKEINLVLDNDKGGQKNIPKYVKLLKGVSATVKIIDLPSKYKDVCDYFIENKKHDFESLPRLTENQWVLDKFSSLCSIIDNEEFLSKQYPEKKWLIKPIMRATGIILIAGGGGVGKTALSYSIAKSISEGMYWLGKYETTEGKILIIDKENEAIDISENLNAQEATSKNIHHYTTPLTFNFINNNGELTDEARFVKAFVIENKISTVILDSLVDFYVGSENDSIDAAQNILVWKEVFPNCAIIPIHHENKPQQGGKRSSVHRIRGSSHLFNASQSVISLSTLDVEYPEKIMVEHSKVRGARKQNPFAIEMLIEQNPKFPDDEDETIITGFKYSGEIDLPKRKAAEAKEAVLELLKDNPGKKFTAKEIQAELLNIRKRRIETILPELRSDRLVDFDVLKMPYTYWHLDEKDNEKDGKLDDKNDNVFYE